MTATLTSGIGGQNIETVGRAAANLPQTATENIFTITGKVKIIGIIGFVFTNIQNQANNTKLGYDPTGGSNDLCANLDIANDAQGTAYSITGTTTDAMIDAATSIVNEMASPLLFDGGAITLTCAANNTGTVAWNIYYIPLEGSAVITAA